MLYFEGNVSQHQLAERLEVSLATVQQWIRNYESMGEDAFLMKHYKRYSKELKLQAVQEYFIDVNDKRVLRICRKKDIKSTIKYSNNGCTGQAANPQYIAENILNENPNPPAMLGRME